MAEKRRFLDVWIVESNTVYREVPFDVVADWVQQARLLEADKVRPSGTGEWFTIGAMPSFRVYLPKPAPPVEEESPVEAYEPVEVGFTWRRKPDDSDTDVDMIPLIDVSLVLLIYFVMRLSMSPSGGPAPNIPIAPAEYSNVVTTTEKTVWVGIDFDRANPSAMVYSLGVADKPAAKDDREIHSRPELLARLATQLEKMPEAELTIYAHKDLKFGEVRQLLEDLQQPPYKGKITKKYNGVSEKRP
jgi:biopolymer transport protein ExbD